MHPLHWVYNNREFLQAISGVAIGLLTLVLIALNIVYVRSNWKTMRLMEADLRFRTKPLPGLTVVLRNIEARRVNSIEVRRVCQWTVRITATNAPMRMLQLLMA